MALYNKWDFKDLPKKCVLKLVTAMQGTPKEIAEALSEPTIRPLWDSKLSSIKQIDNRTLECKYLGIS
jgi:hypothetical protein